MSAKNMHVSVITDLKNLSGRFKLSPFDAPGSEIFNFLIRLFLLILNFPPFDYH